jgi:hypothetical protein
LRVRPRNGLESEPVILYSKFKIKKMDDEEVYVADDVLEEASAARYQMLPKKSKLRYQKELETFRSERKAVSERQ